MENPETPADNVIGHTSAIVAAYVGRNAVSYGEIPKIIAEVHGALMGLGNPEIGPVELTPAVSIRSSVKPDAITCLECGARFKSLKRHLRTQHDLTPDAYRAKWGLPHDYPIVAPNYAERRSELAKSFGLGKKH